MDCTLEYGGATYTRHPLSAIFPTITGEEFETLKASISSNGLRQRILLSAEGAYDVLDGWNRLRACVELGVEARFEFAATDADLIKISLDLNLSRRHLTAGQKAMIAAEIANMPAGFGGRFSERPEQIRGALASRSMKIASSPDEVKNYQSQARPNSDEPVGHPLNNTSSANVNSDTDITEQAETHDQASTLLGEAVSLSTAAQRLGIARSTAALGRRIATFGDDSLKEAVRAGDIALNEAGDIAKKSKDSQADYVKRRLAEGKASMAKIRGVVNVSKQIASMLQMGKKMPEDATPEQAAQAIFIVATDFVRMANVIRALLKENPDCINNQSSTEILAGVRGVLEAKQGWLESFNSI
jgi:ParB-like nuclease domain